MKAIKTLGPQTREGVDLQALLTNAIGNLVLLVTGGMTYGLAVARVWRTGRRPVRTPQRCDWLVVPGHALEAGRPSREFRTRLGRAARLARRHPEANLLLLGGLTPGERRSEARAGLACLVAAGIAPERVFLEEDSRNTLENFQNALRWLDTGTERTWVMVTSRYHLARAATMARNLGLDVHPYPADPHWRLTGRLLARIGWEAYLLHWYQSGRLFARLTCNRAMLERVQRAAPDRASGPGAEGRGR